MLEAIAKACEAIQLVLAWVAFAWVGGAFILLLYGLIIEDKEA